MVDFINRPSSSSSVGINSIVGLNSDEFFDALASQNSTPQVSLWDSTFTLNL